MALTKTTPSSDTGNSLAGSTNYTSAWIETKYGVSGTVRLTNPGSGMTGAPTVYVDYSHDGSAAIGGSSFVLGVGDAINSSVIYIPFSLGIGSGGDFKHMRIRVAGNTGNDVAVSVSYAVTTDLT